MPFIQPESTHKHTHAHKEAMNAAAAIMWTPTQSHPLKIHFTLFVLLLTSGALFFDHFTLYLCLFCTQCTPHSIPPLLTYSLWWPLFLQSNFNLYILRYTQHIIHWFFFIPFSVVSFFCSHSLYSVNSSTACTENACKCCLVVSKSNNIVQYAYGEHILLLLLYKFK